MFRRILIPAVLFMAAAPWIALAGPGAPAPYGVRQAPTTLPAYGEAEYMTWRHARLASGMEVRKQLTGHGIREDSSVDLLIADITAPPRGTPYELENRQFSLELLGNVRAISEYAINALLPISEIRFETNSDLPQRSVHMALQGMIKEDLDKYVAVAGKILKKMQPSDRRYATLMISFLEAEAELPAKKLLPLTDEMIRGVEGDAGPPCMRVLQIISRDAAGAQRILEAMKHADPAVAEQLKELIGRADSPAVVDLALRRGNSAQRMAALEAALQNPETFSAAMGGMAEAMKDPDPAIRRQLVSMAAAAAMNSRDPLPTFPGGPAPAPIDLNVVRNILIAGLNDADPEVASEAFATVLRSGSADWLKDPGTMPLIVRRLARDRPDRVKNWQTLDQSRPGGWPEEFMRDKAFAATMHYALYDTDPEVQRIARLHWSGALPPPPGIWVVYVLIIGAIAFSILCLVLSVWGFVRWTFIPQGAAWGSVYLFRASQSGTLAGSVLMAGAVVIPLSVIIVAIGHQAMGKFAFRADVFLPLIPVFLAGAAYLAWSRTLRLNKRFDQVLIMVFSILALLLFLLGLFGDLAVFLSHQFDQTIYFRLIMETVEVVGAALSILFIIQHWARPKPVPA